MIFTQSQHRNKCFSGDASAHLMCAITEVLTCSSRRAAQCEVWGFCLPEEPQRSLSSGQRGSDGSTQSLLTPESGWCSYPPPPPCSVPQAEDFRTHRWDKQCIDTNLDVPALCLPFFCLQLSLLHSLCACRERQQGLALDLAWHHKHAGFEGVDVAQDVLRHYLWPFRVVPTVRQQWGHDLE